MAHPKYAAQFVPSEAMRPWRAYHQISESLADDECGGSKEREVVSFVAHVSFEPS
ncbi:hypothetical protein PF005_g27827 [Phytophthora fragariae]|uniref:Uncharacterized protein n=1 Tax=Phytophthora fragariae TaxID=53985 RepID=A0A6A3QPS8_9STRA|nr:hypothetical protein PF003_g12773 [Phytophthora fragariae]KAE8921323.1 hypothetical protein PF009_g28394 [Phytophthora fragariae]KAE8969437.1 hypothetical protein PF011_g26805 [Phytophthora fragariae]KAE9067903.1 hypothetical protein PF010_g27282 [Phytophthora fragariae]KAE9074205.1 hypothetical protein PF007_g25502 [Phytophthora fragariae]